jgi:hypothetical protein
MNSVAIILDTDAARDELKDKTIHHVNTGLRAIRITGGMQSGKASVMIVGQLPNSETLVALEMSETMFHAIASAFRGRAQFEDENTPIVDMPEPS